MIHIAAETQSASKLVNDDLSSRLSRLFMEASQRTNLTSSVPSLATPHGGERTMATLTSSMNKYSLRAKGTSASLTQDTNLKRSVLTV